MARIIAIVVAAILVVGGILFAIGVIFNDDPTIDPKKAHTSEKIRSITVYNETGKIINEIKVEASDGRDITKVSNPDEDVVSIKIDKAYEDYDKFTITLKSNHKKQFQKKNCTVKKTGETTISITEKDRINANPLQDFEEWLNKDDK